MTCETIGGSHAENFSGVSVAREVQLRKCSGESIANIHNIPQVDSTKERKGSLYYTDNTNVMDVNECDGDVGGCVRYLDNMAQSQTTLLIDDFFAVVAARFTFWNCPGFCAGLRAGVNACKKLERVDKLVESYDIIGIGEAHCEDVSLAILEEHYCDHRIYICPGVERNQGGIIVIVSKKFISRHKLTVIDPVTLCKGRVVGIRLVSDRGTLSVATAHICPQWNFNMKSRVVNRIRSFFRVCSNGMNVLMGDLNYTMAGEGIYHVGDGVVNGGEGGGLRQLFEGHLFDLLRC